MSINQNLAVSPTDFYWGSRTLRYEFDLQTHSPRPRDNIPLAGVWGQRPHIASVSVLFQIFAVECSELVERNDLVLAAVIQIGMRCAPDHENFNVYQLRGSHAVGTRRSEPDTGALVHNAGSCFVVLIAALLYDRKFE